MMHDVLTVTLHEHLVRGLGRATVATTCTRYILMTTAYKVDEILTMQCSCYFSIGVVQGVSNLEKVANMSNYYVNI